MCVIKREEEKEEEAVEVEMVAAVAAADFSDAEQRQPVNLKPSFRSIFSRFSIIGQYKFVKNETQKITKNHKNKKLQHFHVVN